MTKPYPKNKLQASNSRKQRTGGKGNFLSAIDLVTLAFCSWILLYMSLGIMRVQDAEKHLPIYMGVAVLVLLLAWWQKQLGWVPASAGMTKDRAGMTYNNSPLQSSPLQRSPLQSSPLRSTPLQSSPFQSSHFAALHFIRSIYPVLLFGYFFTSSHAFNRILFTSWQDPFFMQIDKAIFGYYPSLVWGIKYNSWALQELFHFAYFCYYPMIAGLPVYLYFKQPKAFKELIFNLTFVFYLCYTIYSVLPVIGGRYLPEAMQITKTYQAGIFTHIMVFIYRTSNHLGGAFPSSHIAITLVLTVAALRFVPRLGIVFAVIAFFLSLATVYCHYHWFIDAVFGVITGIVGYYFANFVRARLSVAGFY